MLSSNSWFMVIFRSFYIVIDGLGYGMKHNQIGQKHPKSTENFITEETKQLKLTLSQWLLT